MAEELVLKTNEEPTYWNKEALIGSYFFPVGTVIGAIIGKNRMENEKKVGKIVSDETSMWNKDLLAGAVAGNFLSGVAVLGALAIAGGTLTGLPAVIALATLVAAPFIGGYLGGKAGVERQKEEFTEAKQQQLERQTGKAPEPSPATERSNEPGREWVKSYDKSTAEYQQPHR